MRISDWISDVCSSELPIVLIAGAAGVWLFYVQHTFEHAYWTRKGEWDSHQAAIAGSSFYDLPRVMHWFTGNIGYHHIHHLASRIPNYRLRECFERSEEHTSELQSLMRISYAVFCLKKKNTKHKT